MTEFGVQNLASFTFFLAKFQLDRFTLLRLRASYRSKQWNRKNDWIRPFDLEILPRTWIAALATGCFWHFGPRRYVLAWLPALNKNAIKSFKRHILQGWPVDYTGYLSIPIRDSNRFDSIRYANRFESIRFVKKSAFRFTSCRAVFLAYLLYSLSQKNKLLPQLPFTV